MPHTKPPAWIAIAPFIFVVLWATGFVVARLSAGHVEPLTFLAIRFPLAMLVFLGIAMATRVTWPKFQSGMHAAVAGALMHAMYLGPIYWSVAHGMPAGVAALIVGLQPLVTAFLAAPLLGEEISLRHWLGLIVGIIGVGLVLEPKLTFSGTMGISPLTVALCVFGTFAVALGTVYQKRYASSLPLTAGGVYQYAGATVVAFAAASLLENYGFDNSAQAWVALGWSVIAMSLVAILLLMLLIRHGDVSKVSGLIFLVPGVAALMTYVLFDEKLTPVQILGMVVCGAAVAVVTRSRKVAI